MTMASSGASLVKKVTARVFTTPTGAGGNPVSIFLSKSPLESEMQTRLAQQCDWESVVVSSIAADVAHPPRLSFYMPSGDQVNFCAHAAIGAVHSFVRADETRSASQHSVVFSTATQDNNATVDEDDTVGLHLGATFEQNPVDFAKVERLLSLLQLDDSVVSNKWPSLSNSSVARTKTMIGIESVDALQSAQPPSDPEAFRMACDVIQSTGVYLYSPIGVKDETTTYECRQFPSASGYPEDPATGVAAAALAVGLHKECDTDSFFTFHQGTAMGRPSRIKIQDVEFEDKSRNVATYSCWGKVQVDDEEMITV